MELNNPTYILGIIVAIILVAALIIFVLWLLCPSQNTCDTDESCPKSNCGWSGSGAKSNDCDPKPACCTKKCGGLSGSSSWSGSVWPSFGDWFSGNVGVKCD